jgi:hypothetical protein
VHPKLVEDVENAQAAIFAEEHRQSQIKANARHSLTLTGATVGLCFVTLPWVKFLTTYAYIPASLLMIAVVGLAIGCLWSYVMLAIGAFSGEG